MSLQGNAITQGAVDPVALARRAASGDLAPEVAVWIRTGLARHLNAEQLAAARAIVAASVGTARACVQSGLIEVLGDTDLRGHGDGGD